MDNTNSFLHSIYISISSFHLNCSQPYSQNQIFLSDGHESSNSHLQINCALSASYISYYVQRYFWNCTLAYNFMIIVHQGEENAPCSPTAIFLLTPQY